MNNIRYFYLHDKNRHVTVGRIFSPDDQTVAFTYTVCSPKDKFNRKFGREIVEKRLSKWKNNVYSFTLPAGEKPMKLIIDLMSTDESFPPCVRKAATDWLRQDE
jgi:hypothetical protein